MDDWKMEAGGRGANLVRGGRGDATEGGQKELREGRGERRAAEATVGGGGGQKEMKTAGLRGR